MQADWESRHQAIEAKYEVVQQRLATQHNDVQAALQRVEEEEGSIWSPNYKPLKNLEKETKELSERVQRAHRLYTVERHEEETLRISHTALLGEIVTMKLLLRDIQQLAKESLELAQEAKQQGNSETLSSSEEDWDQPGGKDGETQERTKGMRATPAEDVVQQDTCLATSLLEILSPIL